MCVFVCLCARVVTAARAFVAELAIFEGLGDGDVGVVWAMVFPGFYLM